MRCERCGYEQLTGRICESCGRMLTRVRTNATPPPQDAPAPSMVTCTQCGHEQTQGRFCDACGLRIDVYHPPTKKEDSPTTVQYCGNCGLPVSGMICRPCGVRVPNPSESEE